MHLSNGFNGPSITAAWLAYVLATYPDVEEKLIAEIDGITGGDPDYDLRYDDLMALTYTTQVIKETMRIYPPMPITIRRSLKEGTLGRYRIRQGDIILVGTLAAQRAPATGAQIPTGSIPNSSLWTRWSAGRATPSSRSRSGGGSAWRKRSRS
jgi:cytochrome P450